MSFQSNKFIIDIMEKLNGFSKIDNHFLGDVFITDFENAFDLSSIAGCSYLLSPEGVSMKGRNETFIHRSVFQDKSYIYSPGLFGRDINAYVKPLNTLEIIQSKYSSIFSGKKKVILVEIPKGYLSNIEEKIYNKIRNNGEEPSDYLVLKFRGTTGLEPFFEFLIYKHFVKDGYFFENQVPFFQQNFLHKGKKVSGGIPDVSIFKFKGMESFLNRGIISDNTGLCINRLPFLKKFISSSNQSSIYNGKIKYELLLGEVKGSISSIDQANKQLSKYSFINLADFVFSCTPEKCTNFSEYGHMNIKDHVLVKNFDRTNYFNDLNDTYRDTDEEFITTVIKLNLLGNVDFDVLTNSVVEHMSLTNDKFKSFDLIKFTLDHTIEQIFDLVDI